jgi:outer membrane autotransporter protein
MEHRQKTWGGLTWVSASLALILGSLLFLGGGVALAQTYIINGTSGNIIIDGGAIDAADNGSFNGTWSVNPFSGDLAGGNITSEVNISINNTIYNNVANITAGTDISLTGSTNVTINASTGGVIDAGGKITITDSTLNASDSGSGANVTITSVGDIAITNGTINSNGGNISSINSTSGSIVIDGASNLDITGATLDGSISANTSITITGESTVSAGNISTIVDDIEISDGSIVTATDNLVANTSINITESNVTVGGALNATNGDLDITEGTTVASSIKASGNVNITGGNITVNGSAGLSFRGDNITITDATLLNLSGSNQLVAHSDLVINNSTLHANAAIVSENGSITFDLGNYTVGSGISATNGSINISNVDSLVLNGSTTNNILANSSLTIDNVTLIDFTGTIGNINATAGSVVINSSTVNSSTAGNITIGADQSVEIENSVVYLQDIVADNENIAIKDSSNATIKGNITAFNDIYITNTSLYLTGTGALITASNGSIYLTDGIITPTTDGNLFANETIVIDNTTGQIVNVTTVNDVLAVINEANITSTGNITANGIIVSAANLTAVTAGTAITAVQNSSITIEDGSYVNTTGTDILLDNGTLTIDSSTVDATNLSAVIGNVAIIGDSKVNASLINTVNGTASIQGGNNIVETINAVNSNVTVSGGNNTINNLTASYIIGGSTQAGLVKITGGNNTIANVSLVNASLALSGSSTINRITENVTITNGGFESSAGSNTVSANFTLDNATMAFTGGESNLSSINITYTNSASNYTSVSGDDTVVNLDPGAVIDFSAGTNSGFTVTDGATFNSDGVSSVLGNVIVDDAGVLSVQPGGELGISYLELGQGAIINIPVDNTTSAHGYINATTNVTGLTFLNLDIPSNVNVSQIDPTIINGSVVYDGGYIFDPYFGADVVGGNLVIDVAGFTGYGVGIENTADIGGFGYTRNMASAANLVDRVYQAALAGNAQAQILNQELKGAIDIVYGTAFLNPSLSELLIRQTIGEVALGVSNAVANTIFKANSVVLGRLDKIHTADLNTPPAAGEGLLNRAWIGGFGSWAKQDDTDNVAGYKYEAGGFALGYDRTFDGVPGLILGISTSFSFGEIKSNHSLGKIDTDTFGIGIYGSYKFDSGLFLDGTLGYSTADNDAEVTSPLGRKTGSFDIDSWQFGVRGGWIFQAGSFEITPSVGVRYLHLKQDGWQERVTAGLAVPNWFGGYNDDLVEIPLQVKINTTIEAGDAKVTPELRLGWTYAAKELDNRLDMGFVGFGGSTPIWGIKPERSTFQIGAGVKIKVNDTVDVFANYDLDVAKDYRDHKASVGIGFEF